MKKLLIVLVALALLLVLVSCGGGEPSDPSEGEGGTAGGVGEPTPDPTPDPIPDPTPVTTYNIKWFDEKGTELGTTTVNEGDVPSYTYNVTDTSEWDYTFNGWSSTLNGEPLSAIPAASGNASYYACVSAVKQRYTVTFVSNGGSLVSPVTVEYGEAVDEPETPEYSDHRFMGWCTDEALENAVDWSAPITSDVTYYASWNVKVDLGAYLVSLLNGYSMNPYSYLPESMCPGYSANLVDADDVVTNYSSSVSVSQITAQGFGKQWNMIIENLNQSQVFFKALSVVETLTSSSIVAFNNYLDGNPANTAHHTFTSGIYNVSIDFDGQIMYYVLDYTDTIPVLGTQTVQIALALDTVSGERSVRVQLGDANAIRYTMTDAGYTFAIKYAGVRRAYFSVSEDESGNVSGHIYEFITVGTAEVASAADFYVTEDYAVAVGNKADGMIGFTGTIAETYDVDTGKLLGYEVEETTLGIAYNTLWFDLCNINGLQSIRCAEATSSDDEDGLYFYVNGSSSHFESMDFGGFDITKRFSRRFDIEFRTQYFYSYDSVNDEYVQIAVEVPMLFIQEEKLSSFASDVEAENGIELSVGVSVIDLSAIEQFYDELVPVFKLNKESVTADDIVAFIGNKASFEN